MHTKTPVFMKVVTMLVCLAGFMGGCNQLPAGGILLQIGSYKLTPGEYEYIRNSAPCKALTNEQLQDKLIEEGRILAYALDHQYDTIGLLNRQLDYAMRYYASSVDGYVWNKAVKPLLQVSADDIRDEYTKRSNKYLENKKTIPPFEKEQSIIREELLNRLKEKYISESQQQILQETHPHMHEAAIAEMTAKVNVRERTWPGVNPGLVLMEYDFNGARQNYTVANFIEFVHCQPVFIGSLYNPDDVKKMFHSHLISISLFAKAQQMNMEKDSVYQQLRRRYQHRIFINHYKLQPISPTISIHALETEYPVKTNHIKEYQAKLEK
jgi:hypothetical protein